MKHSATWLSAASILVVIFGTIYMTVQQVQRSAANYPQIQLAEDDAAALNGGKPPVTLVGADEHTNLRTSLRAFVIIYDKKGQPVSGSGYLNGKLPAVPVGVLQAAEHKAYNAVTWQPTADVRVASVSVAAKTYYVLSGRSLLEVEKNEKRTLQLVAFGAVAALAVLAIGYQISTMARQ